MARERGIGARRWGEKSGLNSQGRQVPRRIRGGRGSKRYKKTAKTGKGDEWGQREKIQSGLKKGKRFEDEGCAGVLHWQRGSQMEVHKLEEPEEEDTVLVDVGPPEKEGRTAPGVGAA